MDLKSFMSCAPDLIEDGEQNQRQTAPHKYDFFLTIVSNDGYIVLNVWIAIEKLVSPAPDEDSGKQKDDYRDRESDTQRRQRPACSI